MASVVGARSELVRAFWMQPGWRWRTVTNSFSRLVPQRRRWQRAPDLSGDPHFLSPRMNATIVLLPGDGIGPEVVKEARLVLEAVAKRHGHQFKFTEHMLGGCAIDAKGTAMPDETLAACQAADAVFLGA